MTEKINCAPRFLTYGCAVGLDEMSVEIKVNDRTIGLGAHPVGLDLNRVKNALADENIIELAQSVRQDLGDVKLILSVERLDFTKGIIEKLEAFARMLEDHPELKTKVTLMMVCVPAAQGMAIYEELLSQIEQTVGRINGQFSELGWTPVQFFFRALPFEELVAYYTVADVMWITPLRDGLNLVAKEYVATPGLTDGSGVLVLSEFAGAAAELRGAVLANPHHPQELADTCHYALTMSQSEAKNRLSEAFEVVSRYDISYWGQAFIDAVELRRLSRMEKLIPADTCVA